MVWSRQGYRSCRHVSTRRRRRPETVGEDLEGIVDVVVEGLLSAAPESKEFPQPSQCCPRQSCTMRRPENPRPKHSPHSSLHVPWLLLLILFVCLFARPCVSASARANGGGKRGGGRGGGQGAKSVCGTLFTDVESSALLADVVLEGRVRQKVFPKDASPRSPAGGGFYNVSIQVRKQAWKGRELLNGGRKARKLLLGTFRDASPSSPAEADNAKNNNINNNIVNDDGRVSDDGDDVGVFLSCVGQVKDGGTYIFFLRRVAGERKGRYFRLSALPVPKNRRESRKVSKFLRKKAAQKPTIQKLRAPRKVTPGATVTLKCKAKAKPTALYSWFRDGQPLKSGRGLRIRSNKRGSRLKISKAKASSAGVYTCTATNAQGQDSKSVTVKVVEAESIHKPCEKQTFCFNGGSCRYLPELQQTFCQCPKSYEGKRCEKEVAPRPLKGAVSLEYERVLIIVGIVIAFLVFVAICIASFFLAKRRRERWETRRRMKQTAQERERLLDQTDGIRHPPGLPLEKETQTDDLDPPHLPPKRDPGPRPNFTHSTPTSADHPFHMNDHFPVITTTATPLLTSHPPAAAPNGRKAGRPGSGREPREVERRGSRSRLKAVSVDDSCKERPPSWRRNSEGPTRESQHPLGGCPEVIEMNDLSSQPSNTSSPYEEDQVEGLPGFLSSFSSSGHTDEPIRMETPPKDNAHAQLKTPEEQSMSPPSAMSDYDVPRRSAQPASLQADPFPKPEDLEMSPPGDTAEEPGERKLLPINGALQDWDSENEDVDQVLPPLHISEEDLDGNMSKADSMDSQFLPSAPVPGCSSEEASSPSDSLPTPPLIVAAHRPRNQPPVIVDGVGVDGHLQDSFCDDDCGGFLPHALKGSSGNALPPPPPPPRDAYAFDPVIDSDPDDMDQFMHGSPRKSPGNCSAAEVQKDYERRLQKVLSEQEAIPI